jgi:CRISPR-associated protein Csb3
MAEARIPVDLFNPGQVFACLGFVEAAETLLGDAEGGFDWSDEANVVFRLKANGNDSPVSEVLGFLAEAKVSSQAPHGSKHRTDGWQVPTIIMDQSAGFPFPDPPSPATLPAVLTANGKSIIVDHWGDATEKRDNVKFWAGAAGYPGAALARDALELVRERISEAVADPFSVDANQSSSFRFDWRRDYIPMEVGFSPNEHGELTMVGYPLVEILAAIGLGNARPLRVTKLQYHYGVAGPAKPDQLLPVILLRAALGCAELPFPERFFTMKLGWPGQENQARCISDVIEERRQ